MNIIASKRVGNHFYGAHYSARERIYRQAVMILDNDYRVVQVSITDWHNIDPDRAAALAVAWLASC